MKKILMVIIVALAGISVTNAMEMRDYNVLYKLNDNTVFNSLVRYLDINDSQADQLAYVFELTQEKLNRANLRSDLSAAEKAMYFNLGNAKYILSENQYRKYLIILNVSRFSNYEEYIADNK